MVAELSHVAHVVIGISLAASCAVYGLIAVAELMVPRRVVVWRRAMMERRRWNPTPSVGRFFDDLLGEPPQLYARVRMIGAINLFLCVLTLTIGYRYLATH